MENKKSSATFGSDTVTFYRLSCLGTGNQFICWILPTRTIRGIGVRFVHRSEELFCDSLGFLLIYRFFLQSEFQFSDLSFLPPGNLRAFQMTMVLSTLQEASHTSWGDHATSITSANTAEHWAPEADGSNMAAGGGVPPVWFLRMVTHLHCSTLASLLLEPNTVLGPISLRRQAWSLRQNGPFLRNTAAVCGPTPLSSTPSPACRLLLKPGTARCWTSARSSHRLQRKHTHTHRFTPGLKFSNRKKSHQICH